MRIKTLPILLTFLVMGIADALGPMSDAVKKNYELSNVVATLLSFFVFIAFAVFSVPVGLVSKALLLYNGPLLLKTHGVGCYTSQAAMKQLRKNELLANVAKCAASLCDQLFFASSLPLRDLFQDRPCPHQPM
jgi:hypothetical protein